jgi:hypothetical protein
MCTASWWFAHDGSYELFFNRDEQKSRLEAESPRIFDQGAVRFIAPIDANRGGAWIAVNEFGVSVCLVNHYPPGGIELTLAAQRPTSRGQLVLDCAAETNLGDVLQRIRKMDLARFQPFQLLAFARGGDVVQLTWDGRQLRAVTEDVAAPVTSSSFETEAVTTGRARYFTALSASVSPGERPPLEMFHDLHNPSLGAYSVLMNRPDACTVSQTRVRVSTAVAELDYRPIDWNRGWRALGKKLQLPLCESAQLLPT